MLLVWFPFGKLIHAFTIFAHAVPRPDLRAQGSLAVTGSTTTRQPEPLDFDQPRVSIPKPEYRFDMQGEMPEPERVERAMKSFVKDFGRTAAIYMESCIHCGMCAEACHFYESPRIRSTRRSGSSSRSSRRTSGSTARSPWSTGR